LITTSRILRDKHCKHAALNAGAGDPVTPWLSHGRARHRRHLLGQFSVAHKVQGTVWI
jgi:hypothetical protein